MRISVGSRLTSLTPREMAEILRHAAPALLIVAAEYCDRLAPLRGQLPELCPVCLVGAAGVAGALPFDALFCAHRPVARGGRAALRLTDPEDLLETGVEIVAQPPGKKLGNIELPGGDMSLATVQVFNR